MKIVINRATGKSVAKATTAAPVAAPPTPPAKPTVTPEVAALQARLDAMEAAAAATQNRNSIQQSLHTICKQLGVKGYEQPDVQRKVFAKIMSEAKEMGGDVVFHNRAPRIVSSTDPNVQLNKDGNPIVFQDFAKSALQKYKFIDAPAPANKPSDPVPSQIQGGMQTADPMSFTAGLQSRIADMMAMAPIS